jgi:hypothetical protein
MAVAPDLRSRTGTCDERIVGRHASIVVKADDRTVMVCQILRGMRLQIAGRRCLTIAHADEDVTLTIECDARAVVSAAARDRLEDLLDIREAIVL